MCFSINKHAQRPLQTKVWKIFGVLDDRVSLVSPHVVFGAIRPKSGTVTYDMAIAVWPLNEARQLHLPADLFQLGPAAAEYPGETISGLYVWMSEGAARADVPLFCDRYNACPKRLALVECVVHPVDWLYSAVSGRYGGAATYRCVTPVTIIQRYLRGIGYKPVENFNV